MRLEDLVVFRNGSQSDRLNVHHLLTMTSGLDWEEDYGPFGDPTVMLFRHSLDMADFASARGQAYEPGTNW